MTQADTHALQVKILGAINRAQSLFIANTDKKEAFDQLLADLLALTESEYGFIGEVLRTPAGDPYLKTHAITNIAWSEQTRAFYDEHAPKGMEFYNLKSLFGAVLTTAKPVIANDPYHDPRRGGLPEGHPPLNAFLGIPILIGERMVAMAGIANRPGGYDQDVIDFLQPLLATIGQLVEARNNRLACKASEAARAQSSAFLASVLNAASEVSIIATDPQGVITVFNNGAERLLGYSAEEMVGKQSPAIFHLPAEVEARSVALSAELGRPVSGFRVFVEVPEHQGAERREWTYVRKTGEHVPVSLVVTAMRAANGETSGYLGIAQNISERKQAQKELNQFKATLDHALDCVFMIDPETLRFIYANQGAQQQVGYSLDELLEMHPYDIKPEISEAEFRKLAQPLLASDQASITFETVHRHKDGRRIPVEVFLQYITPAGESPRFINIVRDISERKQSEQAFKEQASHTQAILDHMVDGLITIDQRGIIASFNRAAERIFGYTPNEVLGQNVKMLMPNPHRDAHDSYLHNYQATGVAHVIGIGREVEGQRKDGSLFPMELAVSEVSRQGAPLYVGMVRDISERKQVVAALLESRNSLQCLMDSMTEGAYGVNTDGMCTFVNAAFLKILGYRDAESVLGKHIHSLIHHSHVDGTPYPSTECKMYRAYRAHENVHSDDEVFWRADGTPIPVEYWSSPIIQDGRVVGAIATFIDISERKATETVLKEQARHTQAILDHMVDGLITIDQRGTITSFNLAAERIFGYTPDEVLGQNVKMLMPNPHRDAHDGYLHNYQATGVARVIGIGREVEGLRKNGSLFPMELAVSEVTRQGAPLYVGMVRDISERKRIERMKTEFVSTVSHELRTPLTSISGALGLLAGGALGNLPDQARSLIDIAHKNSKRLTHLINDLLDMEKIAAGKMHFDMQPQALVPLIEQSLEGIRSYSVERRVNFSLDQQMEAPEVRVDSQRLLQVLSNLLSNAVKYSPEGGTVDVAVRQVGCQVRVEVADHGPGIPAEFRSRIFQKFSQADSSDTRQKGGTGLGLAITKELVERMGGRIGFESEEDKGTCFYFELPLCNLNVQNPVNDPHLPSPGDDVPRILVVEDEPDIAKLLGLMLTRAGYVVETATTGTQALQALEQSSYAAMTLDLMLPDIGGLEIIHQVRQTPKTSNLPIIVVSAKMEEGKLAIDGDFSGIDWMSKPIDETRLLSAVRGSVAGEDGQQLRVLHVEDDADMHQVIKAMAGDHCEFELATTLTDAQERVASERFDVVILDLNLPDGSGWDMLPALRARQPSARIVILSGADISPDEIDKVEAVLLKSRVSSHDLLNAIQASILQSKKGGHL